MRRRQPPDIPTDTTRLPQSALADAYDQEWSDPAHEQPYTAFWRFPNSARAAADAALGALVGQCVAELAPGHGASTLRLLQRGAGAVVAVELSRGGLAQLVARARDARVAGRVAPLCADVHALPLASGAVDRVYGENFLMYIDVVRLGGELARVLRPGGRAVLLEPTAHHPFVRLYRRIASPYRVTTPRYFSLDTLSTLAAPFSRVTHREFYLLAVLALPLARRPFLFALAFRALDALDRLLLRVAPPLRRWCWLTVITLDR